MENHFLRRELAEIARGGGRERAGAGGGCGRSSAMSRKISWNTCRGMATSAICTSTSMRRSMVMRSRATDGRSAS